MKLISVNVGWPREVEWQGRRMRSSIWKTPVDGAVRVRASNLDGDEQSDLSVHGGVAKAVYAYPSEHYEAWRRDLPGVELPWGAFGENLTIEGLSEHDAGIGDRLRIGTAELVVTQPRLPCAKLAMKFDRLDLPKIFLASRRTGFYMSVASEGDIRAGDAITDERSAGPPVTVSDLVALFAGDELDRELVRRASEHPQLLESWRERFRRRLIGEGGRA